MGSLRSWSTHRVEAVVVDDKDGDGSSKHLTESEVKPLSRQGSSASSSSSSDSSQDLVKRNDANDKPLEKSEQPGLESSPAPFRVTFASSSTEQSPQNQNQNQMPAGYEPNRIPSSVFSGRPATPMDWSTASNESLFSIHVGNNSFSKDQFFMLYKSGELTKFDEQIIAQGNLPPLNKLEDKSTAATEMSMNKTMVAETSKVAEDHSHQKPPPAEKVHNPISAVVGNHSEEKKFAAEVQNSPTRSISGRSDGSNNSTLSFAFPLLTGEGGRVSSVNGDQNNNKDHHHHTQSEKQPQKKQSKEELQPQTPVTPQNAAGRSWFSWFYCCRCS